MPQFHSRVTGASKLARISSILGDEGTALSEEACTSA